MTGLRYRNRRRIGGVVLAVVAVTVALLAFGTPAWAHSRLERALPAAGATVTAPMSTVTLTLTFNEPVRGDFTTVVVSGPDHVSYSRGHVRVVDDNVYQAVYPLRSGAYTVSWRAVSADGHPVDGQFRFTVALPPGQEPTAGPPTATAAPQSSGGDMWLWIGVAAAVVIVSAVLVILGRRRRRLAPGGHR